MKKRYIVLLLLLGLFLVSCSNIEQGQSEEQSFKAMESSMFRAAEVQNCRVTADQLEVKSGAGENFNTIASLNRGDVVRVMGKIDTWYVIRLSNYRIGCIDATETEPVVKNNGENGQSGQPDQSAQPTEPEPEQPERDEETPAPSRPGQAETGRGGGEQESRLITLVNEERRKNDLPVLRTDSQLSRVARVKAQDMVDNDYFSHYSPTYGSPFEMLDHFGVGYQYAGENLSKNTTVNSAHQALMGSSGHRKNILNPNFTNIGVGVREVDRGYIYVELFTGVPE
ncbi:MAG TPA: CAP domain-containing protein [Halanaerobiales bacterium]|nr:CAP domain-containing protein [Halanaerobiales bacterium]